MDTNPGPDIGAIRQRLKKLDRHHLVELMQSIKMPPDLRLDGGLETARLINTIFDWAELNPDRLRSIDEQAQALLPIPPQDLPPCPYKDLQAFQEADADLFFGRDADTDDLLRLITASSFVAVVGASGSGKSSLVLAGLLPKLRATGTWLIVTTRPANRPFKEMATRWVDYLYDDPLQRAEALTERLPEQPGLPSKLRDGTIGLTALADLAREKARQAHLHIDRLLLVIDQFEELFTNAPEQEQAAYLSRLTEATAAESGPATLTVLITLRADFLGHALAFRDFATVLDRQPKKIIGPLGEPELRAAIEMPVKDIVQLEPGLTEQILADLATGSPATPAADDDQSAQARSSNLPLLQFTLSKLWERQSNGRMTLAAYAAMGGVHKALAHYADEVLQDSVFRDKEERIRRIFIQLVAPGEGTVDTRQIATRSHIGEDNWDLVQQLATRRLVVTSNPQLLTDGAQSTEEAIGEAIGDVESEDTVEVVHEALIRHWGKLHAWMREARTFRMWQNRLRLDVDARQKNPQDEGILLRGGRLAEAKDMLGAHGEWLSGTDRNFIEASIDLEQRQVEEKEAQRRQKDRARKLTIIGLAVVLVIISMITTVAVFQWDRAENQAQEAFEAQERAEQNEARAKEAQQQAEEQAEKARRGIYNLQLARVSDLWRHQPAQALAFLNDIERAPLDLRDFTWRYFYRLAKGYKMTLRGHTTVVSSVAFAADGRTLASASRDRTIKLWDAESGAERATLEGHTYEVSSVAFAADGRTLASASRDGTIKLWDAESGAERATLEGHTDRVSSVAFAADGRTLASASGDRTIKLWDTER